MWGLQADNDQIDFEWPPQAEFNDMDKSEVSLKSFIFKSYSNAISSVQVTLSNGHSSPAFAESGTDYIDRKTIQFDDCALIRAVAGAEFIDAVKRYG